MKPTEQKALNDLEKAVSENNSGLLETALDSVSDQDAALQALTNGLDAARERLGNFSSSVAEFLLSVDVMRLGLKRIKKINTGSKGRVVIGVVRGDVHDLGKNIVAGVMEACGYEVLDLGRDVSPENFVDEAEKFQASIMALSTMMSTPLQDMGSTIQLCRTRLPKVKIIVGGAPLDEKVAQDLGADSYVESAVGVPELLSNIRENRKSHGKGSRVFVDYDKRLRIEEA